MPGPDGWKLVAQAAERKRAREIWDELDAEGHFAPDHMKAQTREQTMERHPSGRRIRTRRGQQ